MWTFEPLTPTKIAVPANGTALVQYRVTNQSSRPRRLAMPPIQGITQITTGLGICGNPFVLRSKNSCILSLQINGSQLKTPVTDGPLVCQQGSALQCYQPGAPNAIQLTQAPPISDAEITVTGSPLTLTANGSTGQLTINNTSTHAAATNITSNFTGTALDGNVAETGNTCANVPPGGSCTLTYTPGNTVVAQTNFTIQGSNTNALTTAIAIQSGSTLTAINLTSGTTSGGTGFTLTGTGLTGATGVTFDGIAATSINVISSTMVTGVTPAHAAGIVDVVIDTPAGNATLANGYTYVATAVGQSSGGGTIACINGGVFNLVAATADNALAIRWRGYGIITGAVHLSNGAINTQTIVNALGDSGGVPYAAKLCDDYEVDSQGNTPCEPGNFCYQDWFLPARFQLFCLYDNRAGIGGFANGGYWMSNEATANNAAYLEFFDGLAYGVSKNFSRSVRCVRAFTPYP